MMTIIVIKMIYIYDYQTQNCYERDDIRSSNGVYNGSQSSEGSNDASPDTKSTSQEASGLFFSRNLCGNL